MKSILYVGATLMIGASIYGFVDFKKTNRNKEFTTLYESKETVDPDLTSKKYPDETAKKEVISKEKAEVTDKKTATKTATPVVVKKNKISKKKKVNHKMFSRGSMEDRYIHKEALKLAPPKTEKAVVEIKKPEVKEQ